MVNYQDDNRKLAPDEKIKSKANAITYFQNELEMRARNSDYSGLYKGLNKMRIQRKDQDFVNSIDFAYRNKE